MKKYKGDPYESAYCKVCEEDFDSVKSLSKDSEIIVDDLAAIGVCKKCEKKFGPQTKEGKKSMDFIADGVVKVPEKKTEGVNIAPSWMAIYPLLEVFIYEGNKAQKEYVCSELKKLCAAVDEQNEKEKA